MRPIRAADRPALVDLLQRTENFLPDEVEVALELVDAAIEDAPGNTYVAVVAVQPRAAAGADGGAADAGGEAHGGDEQVIGYSCFGPTPMTAHTWDLYWIAADPALRGRGVGAGLLRATEGLVAEQGGVILRAETSSKEAYGGTLAFYQRTGFTEGGRIPDFYRAGDDLVVLYRRLDAR